MQEGPCCRAHAALDGAGSDSETNGTMPAEPCSPAGAAGAGAVCRDMDATRATDESNDGRISPQGVTWCGTRKTSDGSVQLINSACSHRSLRSSPTVLAEAQAEAWAGAQVGGRSCESAFNIHTAEPARGTSKARA